MTWATGTAVLGPYFKVRYLGHPLAAPIPLSRVHRPTECAHQEPMFSLDPTLNTGNLETPYSDGPTATPRACTAASIVHLHRSQLTVTKLPQEHRKCRRHLHAEAGMSTWEETTAGCRLQGLYFTVALASKWQAQNCPKSTGYQYNRWPENQTWGTLCPNVYPFLPNFYKV